MLYQYIPLKVIELEKAQRLLVHCLRNQSRYILAEEFVGLICKGQIRDKVGVNQSLCGLCNKLFVYGMSRRIYKCAFDLHSDVGWTAAGQVSVLPFPDESSKSKKKFIDY